jgi:hypothetical protein
VEEKTPSAMAQAVFAHWCIWEQARPALVDVLARINLTTVAEKIEQATDLKRVLQASADANESIRSMRAQADPLGASAAEAAAYEFEHIVRAANENDLDADAIAFFAARVCGWAGWAHTDFKVMARKAEAEAEAHDLQKQKYMEIQAQYP